MVRMSNILAFVLLLCISDPVWFPVYAGNTGGTNQIGIRDAGGEANLSGSGTESDGTQSGAVSPGSDAAYLKSSPDDIYWDNSMSHVLKGIDGPVFSLMVFEDRLVAAGRFSAAGNALANSIAAWDGTTWFPLGSGLNGNYPAVQALVAYNGNLVAGGSFTSADETPVRNVALWDGNSWAPMGDGLTDTVSALAVYDGDLYAATYTGHTSDSYKGTLSRWDGSSWIELGSQPQTTFNALLVFDSKLIVGTGAGLLAWDGASLSPWQTDLTGVVRCLIEHNGQLFVGGRFRISGQPANEYSGVASWNDQWTPLYTSASPYIYNMFWFDNRLFAVSGGVMSWDGNSWSTPSYFSHYGYLYFTSFATYHDKLIFGGAFSFVGDNKAGPNIAVWDGLEWSNPNTGFDDRILALQTYQGELIVGGSFLTTGDGTAARGIAAWDGTSWSALGSGLEGPTVRVTRMTVYEDKLVIAGYFALPGGTPANNVASWDGANWAYLGEWTYGEFGDLIVYNHQLLATESYDRHGTKGGILVWDGQTWIPFGTIPQDGTAAYGRATIFDGNLVVDHIYVRCPLHDCGDCAGSCEPDHCYTDMWDGIQWQRMGDLFSYGAVAYTEYHGRLIGVFLRPVWTFSLPLIYEWNNEAWDLMDGISTPYPILSVADLQVNNDKLYTAGRNMYEWDGDTLLSLGSGTNGIGRVMTVYRNNLVVAGDFTVAGGKVAGGIAAWTKHDVRKVTLDVKPGSCLNPINGNSANGQGKAVLPVAIMGTADFDVRDIDPATITLNGSSPVRWNYEDVGTPPDDPDAECACSEAGPDGYTDFNLKFYSAEVVASLKSSDVVRVEGRLYDGTLFDGQDCVRPVGPFVLKEDASDEMERGFELIGNYPNPFNPDTRIVFYLPKAAKVKLEIFNILGQQESVLIDQSLEAGEHSVVWDGSEAASGIHYYRLKAGESTASGRMVLLK